MASTGRKPAARPAGKVTEKAMDTAGKAPEKAETASYASETGGRSERERDYVPILPETDASFFRSSLF